MSYSGFSFRRCFILVAATVLLVPDSVFATPDPATSNSDWSFDGSLRSRTEYVDWLRASGTPSDDPYVFEQTKLNIGARYTHDIVAAYVQGQYFQLYDLPQSGVGPGATYSGANEGKSYPGGVIIRQANLTLTPKIGENDFQLIAGRFLYTNGSGYLNPAQDVEALKKARINNRVLGPSDYDAGRSFDGGSLTLSQKGEGSISASFFLPTQGVTSVDGGAEIHSIQVATTAFTLGKALIGDRGESQVFYYYYSDQRGGIAHPDNRPADVRAADTQGIEVHNVGLHNLEIVELDSGVKLDSTLWGILQAGRYGTDDMLAGALTMVEGISLEEVAGKPAFHLGYSYGSGDGNPNDSHHHTFLEMLPSRRQYALAPFYNMMNNQDFFTEADVTPATGLKFQTSLHYLELATKKDLLYTGSGAGLEIRQFGYSTMDIGTQSIGALANFGVSYDLCKNLTSSLYYGHLFPSGGLHHNLGTAELDYGYLEVIAKY